MPVRLIPFKKEHIQIIAPWFDDKETQKWLGDRSWIDNIFRSLSDPVGKEFRGCRKVAYYPFVAFNGEAVVGFIDCGIQDCYVKYGGELEGQPIYHYREDILTSFTCFTVGPEHRGKGYAREMIRRLTQAEQLSEVELFCAGVEPENTGSIRALVGAGFTTNHRPDFEGLFEFRLRRRQVTPD